MQSSLVFLHFPYLYFWQIFFGFIFDESPCFFYFVVLSVSLVSFSELDAPVSVVVVLALLVNYL